MLLQSNSIYIILFQLRLIKVEQKNRANLTTSSINVMNNDKMCNTLTKNNIKKKETLRTNN
jgi:hypothetical protein